MSPSLLQRSQLWKQVPVSSVMLSDPYYKQKEGHEFVLSAFVSLMLGTVLCIQFGCENYVSETVRTKDKGGGVPMVT